MAAAPDGGTLELLNGLLDISAAGAQDTPIRKSGHVAEISYAEIFES
ncbi:MAG: hypothetical protein AB1591_10185 [Pseudomonadota bacterium]